MKTKIFGLALLLVTSNAFATHAYRSEDCKSKTLSLRYTGNYPIGGDYAISRIGSKAELKAYQPNIDQEESGSDVIYTELKSVSGKSKDSSDCYFDHSEWSSRKLVKINWLTKQAAARLHIQKGDVIVFKCEESSDQPTGKECN